MQNELIKKVATLMADQTTAYNRLQSAARQLSAALVQGEPDNIESLSRAGETELMRMRARLLEMKKSFADDGVFEFIKRARAARGDAERPTHD